MLDVRIRELRGTVLDVGGGRHGGHDEAWGAGVRRFRLDLSEVHRPDLVGDALHLPVRDGSLDVVAMVEVLEHVPDPWRAVEEARRVLRPGGVLLGSAPLVWPIHGDPHDYFRFTDAGLRVLLRGFADATFAPIGNHYSAAWVLVTARSRLARVLNPVVRGFGKRADARCPEGYVFIARR
jgi:SAM-dependent methyltransferase